jgi:surfactin synthase thioesterase subunit
MNSEKIKVICIPYAGGNKYSFRGLQTYLAKGMDCVTLELPGRGARLGEPFLSNLDLMVKDLYQQLLPLLGQPYVLLGHSMGGILGNLLIHHLQKNTIELPLHFFVTGCASPSLRNKRHKIHALDKQSFSEAIKALGGLPDGMLNNPELMDFFLPIIRADIATLEQHQYQFAGKHAVPIIAIAGTEEAISEEELQGWGLETEAAFRALRYPGNHFFILQQFDRIAALIQNTTAPERWVTRY